MINKKKVIGIIFISVIVLFSFGIINLVKKSVLVAVIGMINSWLGAAIIIANIKELIEEGKGDGK